RATSMNGGRCRASARTLYVFYENIGAVFFDQSTIFDKLVSLSKHARPLLRRSSFFENGLRSFQNDNAIRSQVARCDQALNVTAEQLFPIFSWRSRRGLIQKCLNAQNRNHL